MAGEVEGPTVFAPLSNTAAQSAGSETSSHSRRLRRVLIGLCAAFTACFAGLMGLLLLDREPYYGLGRLEVTANSALPSYGGEVGLSGREVEPAARDLSGRWDSSLFYWLEETDAGSEEDGNISRCEQSRFQAVRSDTGDPTDYEVYRDAFTGEVYKAVSIEHTPTGLELTDYYYQQGKLNFVFRRSDSIYTPTYASIDRAGERFSFNQDQMTRWRFIEQPQVVKQWILALDDTPYQQWAYDSLTDAERTRYDEKEREILNDGYHTYQTVMEHRPTQILAGQVVDGGGRPVPEAWVGVCRAGEDKAIVKLETDGQGR